MKSILPCPHFFQKWLYLMKLYFGVKFYSILFHKNHPNHSVFKPKSYQKINIFCQKSQTQNFKIQRLEKLYFAVLSFLEIQFHRIEAELRIMKMSNFSFDVITYPQKVYKYTIFCTLHSIFKSHNKTCTLQRYSMFINWIGIASKTYCFLSKHKNYKPSKSIFVSTKISQQYQLQESLAITIVSQKKKKTYSFKPYVQLLPQQY
eukprot:TRINITY_DN144_c0_g2_i1.p1 TRINITY_DN144_c0_g2~~TRINITY_DN144_c0_g2_i1.p1  ORF type:complete len:204 (+),score=-16.60 TRINITY_DN144_c0_g2_i1:541-1152(+)